MDSCIRLGIVALFMIATVQGCGGSSEAGAPAPAAASAERSTQGEPYPRFDEGGELALTVQGQQVTVKIDFVDLANTDAGYPDYLEVSGSGTYLCARIDPKMPDGEDEAYYKPIVGRA